MASRSSRGTRGNSTRGPRTHEGPSGFSWTVSYPERAAAPMRARKPQATIVVEGSEPIRLPVAVARKLEASDAPMPSSRAELLYNVRVAADECAWAKLIDLVSRRDYSSREAAERLVREGYSSACAQRVVERAVSSRIVNDARFAEYFVRAKVAAGWGPMRIERELSRRGVSAQDVVGWPEEFFGDEGPEQRARELLECKAVPSVNAYPKLVRFLVSRGYPISVAKAAVSERLADEGQE